MSEYLDHRLPVAGRLKMTACTVAAVLSLALGAGSAALAQNATPASTPAPACNAPALPPGAPSTPSAAASPSMDNMNMATPAATPAPAPAGTPADAATSAAIAAAAQNIANCGNSNDYPGLAALITANMMQQGFQTTNPYDVVATLKQNGGQHFGDFKTSNSMTYADGSVSVDATYMQAKYQLATERWTLVKDGDYWKLDHFDTLAPKTDLDTSVVGVDLAGAKDAKTGKYAYTITPATASAAVSPAIQFHARNLLPNAENHELLILQLPAGATLQDVFSGKVPQSSVTFIGQIQVPSGTERDLLLVGLPAGDYTMACFITGPDGVPHAMEGMTAKFTITPAS